MAKKYIITSGKGGVGVTTITGLIGSRLAYLKKRVLLIDLDIGFNNLDILLGIEDQVTFDIFDVIEGRCRLRQAIVPSNRLGTLHYISSFSKDSRKLLTESTFAKIINILDSSYDYIFIDVPIHIMEKLDKWIEFDRDMIVVTTPYMASIRGSKKVIDKITCTMSTNIYLIINRVRGDLILDGEMIDIDTIIDSIGIDIIGIIPEDDYICVSSMMGDCSFGVCRKSIDKICNIILSKKYEIYDCTKKYRGVLGYIKRSIKRVV